jgi:hypothetical protein
MKKSIPTIALAAVLTLLPLIDIVKREAVLFDQLKEADIESK